MDLGLGAPMSDEDQYLRSLLYMNEKDSDVKFKVEGQIIPAHKKVLIENSRFFAGLFKSGMTETKQDVIEINDCDFGVFQGFLRFIYCDEIKFDDEHLLFKLLDFSDKYVQDDLHKRCIFYLKSNITSKTVFTIFDEAYARDLENLLVPCVKHLRANITLNILSEIIESQVLKHSLELRDRVFNWIIENYFEIYLKRNEDLRLCEEFLVKNITKETIVRISQLIAQESYNHSFKSKEVFEQETMKLRSQVFCFMRENWKEMNQEQIKKGLPKEFLMEMFSYMFKTDENKEKDEKARDKKRMEPNQEDNKEKPELKKTKNENKRLCLYDEN